MIVGSIIIIITIIKINRNLKYGLNISIFIQFKPKTKLKKNILSKTKSFERRDILLRVFS